MQNCYCNNKMQKRIQYNNFDNLSLAMAYVPWQKWQSVYEPEKAINIGTIFPELNKPFTGRRGVF